MVYKSKKRAETVARILNMRSGYPLARAYKSEHGWEIMSSYAFGMSYGVRGEEASTAASLAAMMDLTEATDADMQHCVITQEQLLSYPDGTWIMTDHDATKILDTARWSEPQPSGFLNGSWWRRNQLMDHLGHGTEAT